MFFVCWNIFIINIHLRVSIWHHLLDIGFLLFAKQCLLAIFCTSLVNVFAGCLFLMSHIVAVIVSIWICLTVKSVNKVSLKWLYIYYNSFPSTHNVQLFVSVFFLTSLSYIFFSIWHSMRGVHTPTVWPLSIYLLCIFLLCGDSYFYSCNGNASIMVE